MKKDPLKQSDLTANSAGVSPATHRMMARRAIGLKVLNGRRAEVVPKSGSDPVAVETAAELDLAKGYSEQLVAKLEEKNLELEQRTEALQTNEARLLLQSVALETAANSIIITDRKGIILWINPAFTALTGYSKEEILGKTPRVLKSGKQDQTFYRDFWKTITSGQSWRGEFANLRKDGTLCHNEHTVTPVRSTGGDITHFIAIMHDVTERKSLEEKFIQSQKMEVVGHLAGGVAHDFNNILAVIMGYCEIMNLELGPEHAFQKYCDEIRHAAERAAALTQQLLIFSRKQKLQPAVLDLNQVLANINKMLRRLIHEHIALTIVPGKEIGRFKADPNHVGQILMNLVVNASDAMPGGGQLTISTSNVTFDEQLARAHAGAIPGDYVMLSISDTGTGMTDEIKARIFEPFFTTKPVGKGTGLGLATCQTIVQQSGGHIGVYSEVGKGTTFRIYFPRVEQPLDTAAGAHQAGPLPRGTETLLLVEDESSVRHMARGVLQTQGYEVLSAANGQDALNLARDHQGPPIRLVVTDVIMPRMGGKVMAEWLKTTYPELKVLFTSGYTDDVIVHDGVLEPGVEFLAKPYTPVTLVRKVRAILDNQTDTAFLRNQGVTINQGLPSST